MRSTCVLISSIFFSILVAANAMASGPATNFTFQGRLVGGEESISGTYDVDFGLWNAASGGWEVAEPLSVSEIFVRDGKFIVDLDFSADLAVGSEVFMSACIKPAASGGPCTELASRQPLKMTPEGLQALSTGNENMPTGELIIIRADPQLVIDQGRTGIGTEVPKSTLDVAGNLTLRTRTVATGPFGTITVAGNDLVLFTSASDDYYVTLPPASAETVGRVYMIYATSPSSYVQLQADGTDSISGTTYGGGSVFYFMVIGTTATSWASVAVGL